MTTLAPTIMVMGTSSSAGKSLVTTALCRCFARRGWRVAPFKAQNMSNNAAVCADGGEIGRSQALQAMAAKAPPSTDMNPILLKPEGNTRSQVILNGRPYRYSTQASTDRVAPTTQSMEATEYFRRRQELWPHVTAALHRLRTDYDLVVIEGAGSPAELNLRHTELVNMAIAEHCQSPILLIGDIERGGIFAQLLGTLWLLEPHERSLVRGLLVNKFRGDLRLFDTGVKILEERGQLPVLGVLPWIDDLRLPEEDAVALLNWTASSQSSEAAIDVAVIHLPHIANFDDFDPLRYDQRVHIRYVRSLEQLGAPRVLILPGTKNTQGDLAWLRRTGLAEAIWCLREEGRTQIVGICGGYQMLGRTISDPQGLESGGTHAKGLGLLEVDTTFYPSKQTRLVRASLVDDFFLQVSGELLGYEIHMGQTQSNSAWLKCEGAGGGTSVVESLDGARSPDGQVWGCYLHGLFGNDSFRHAWLKSLGASDLPVDDQHVSSELRLDRDLDGLADVFEKHVDMKQIESWVQLGYESQTTRAPT